MPSHWVVIEPLLNRWGNKQPTSNQQAGNLLPGIALDLGLWTLVAFAAVGFRMTVTTGSRVGVWALGGRRRGWTLHDGTVA
jgi:hypothetical protein